MSMVIMLLGLILLFVLLPFAKCHDVSNLIATVIVFRHGARTPGIFFANDPYANKSYWPEGIGELTEQGKIEACQLGQWLRERYDGFLPRQYSKEDIYIRSTDIDRSIISAQFVAVGLYPFSNNNSLLSNPVIPVHTVPVNDDMLFRTYKQCTKYYSLHVNYCKSDYFIEISNYSILNQILLKHLGQKVEPHQIAILHDTWSCEEAFNLSLPEWTSEVYPTITAKAAVLNFASRTSTPEISRLAIGVFFHEMKTYFLQMKELIVSRTRESNTFLPKMKLYSGHDFNLIDIKNVLGVYDYNFVSTSSAVMIELRKTVDIFYVNLYFKDQDRVEELKLKECSFDCVLDTFLNIIEPVTITAEVWKKECIHHSQKCFQTHLSGIFLFLDILVLIVLVSCLMYHARSHPRNKQCCFRCKYRNLMQDNNTALSSKKAPKA